MRTEICGEMTKHNIDYKDFLVLCDNCKNGNKTTYNIKQR